MGVLRSLLGKVSLVALTFLLIAAVPGLPPHADYQPISVGPIKTLEGALAINSLLNNAEHLFEGEIHGPESLAAHDGHLYTSVHGGHILRISNDKFEPIVKFGQPCEGFHEEEKCGRPLGLTFDQKGALYVADCYYGLYKVNVTTGKYTRLVSVNDTIDGKRPMVPNSVAVSSTGVVFWTDSSTNHKLHDGVFDTLASGSGRLLQYNPTTSTNTVLLDKIHFANGIALSDDESFLVISETVQYRVLRYHLKGPKAGKVDVFLDGLPGFPDNIQPDGHGGFIVSLVFPYSDLLSGLNPYPLVRKLLARLLFLGQIIISFLRDLYPIHFLKQAAHLIGHFELTPPLSVKLTTVLYLTREGNINRSLHATDGLLGISDCVEFNGHYYLGSPFNRFLARVKANYFFIVWFLINYTL